MKIPKYRKNPDGRGFAKYPGKAGKREYFGKFDDPESLEKYKSWLTRLLEASRQQEPDVVVDSNPDVNTLSLAYLVWAERYFSGEGDWLNVRATQAMLIEFAGDVLAASFGPSRLREFQGFLLGRGLARTTINSHVGRVRRFFRWCQSRELTPRGHATELECVLPLMPGRSEAPEPQPVEPIAWAVVARTLPHLSPPIAAAVRVQYLCGTRPDEVLRMRAGEIDRTHAIWFWRPKRHKNSRRLQSLSKAIPKAAQEVLLPLLARKRDGQFLFSPVDAAEWKKARRPRKTKIFPCELYRVKDALKGRKLLDYYSEPRYGKEIGRGIFEANYGVQEESERIPHWTPNQLRHAIASEVSAILGEQASQRWLGHARLETTGLYTAQHERELREIAEQLDQHLPR